MCVCGLNNPIACQEGTRQPGNNNGHDANKPYGWSEYRVTGNSFDWFLVDRSREEAFVVFGRTNYCGGIANSSNSRGGGRHGIAISLYIRVGSNGIIVRHNIIITIHTIIIIINGGMEEAIAIAAMANMYG